MALFDLAHTSQYGPVNPNGVGTGFTTGPNANPLANMPLGNPIKTGKAYNDLYSASHSSLLGPYNKFGKRGPGFIPTTTANSPSELPFI